MNILHIISLIIVNYFQLCYSFDPSEKFDRETFLDTKSLPTGDYRLFWKVVGEDIIFEAHVKTLGWLGLGFSPTGGMTGADLMVGGVKNGQPYIYDRHATLNGFPLMDSKQNYEALYGAENATHTVLKFKRKLTTCDVDDYAITNDTVKLIWAYNPTDATNENQFEYHSQRGTRSILLLEESKSLRAGTMPSDIFTFDINITNAAIPGDYDTMYMCKVVKIPSRAKAHFIKYEPIIQKGNEAFVHHILIYHCLYDMSNYVNKQEECFNRDHTKSSDLYKCTSRYLAGWAVGAEAVVYPENLGYPFFENDSSPYMMLEIHYDNSKLVQGVTDNSGLRLYLTSQLRPTEIGSIIFGMQVDSNSIVIPPGQNLITLTAVCDGSCTQNYPPEGLNFMGAFLHEHVHGKAVRMRHIRNGVEFPPIAADNFYDFNYQEQRFLKPSRLVLPNDVLIVECDYATSSDPNATFGGFTTKDEMCLVFIDYYPKSSSMIGCYSGPTITSYVEAMGGNYNSQNKTIMSSIGQYNSVKNFTLALNWKEDKKLSDDKLQRTPMGQIFQQKINTGTYFEGCMQRDTSKPLNTNANSASNGPDAYMEPVKFNYFESISYPRITTPFVKPNLCAVNQSSNLMSNNSSPAIIPNNPSSNGSMSSNMSSGPYTHHLIMDNDGKYHLFWRYDDTNVTFEIQAQARGWVGLGFSPNGGMAGADIINAYIDSNGAPQLSDRFAPQAGFPVEDTIQDYTLLRGMKNATHITVSFTRKQYTCDQQDMPLTNDTVRAIYAYSDVVPESRNNFQMHDANSRGTKSLRLFEDQVPEKPMPADVIHLDIGVTNVKIPDDYHTLYWCQIFALPNMTKHHIIKIEPMIQKDNSMVVHHLLLYACKNDMSQYIAKGGEPCFDRSGLNFSPMMECTNKYLAGWAVGGGSIVYPDNIGLPIFEAGGDRQVMLEMHYDNSNMLKNKVDSSAFRLHMTPNLRPIEAGSLSFGVGVNPEQMMIPAGQTEFTQYTYCYSNCTSWFPKEGVNAFSGLLHTHLAGRKIRIRHIRNGVQLEDLFADEHYDFNYQASTIKKTPVKILPGDEFITECVYETTTRTETTYAGFATRQEMCLMFVDIYPRLETGEFLCFSHPSYGGKEWKDLFNANYSLEDDVFIMPNGSNMTARQFAETQVKFPNQTVVQKFQDNVRNGDHVAFCNAGINKTSPGKEVIWKMLFEHGPPKITTPFKPTNVCLREGGVGQNNSGVSNMATTTALPPLGSTLKRSAASSMKPVGILVFLSVALKMFYFS